jgi:glycosyltransferase involved in cell wall biosynthesis
MKAQACGCACVVTDFAALAETVQAGIKIDGCAGEPSVDQAFLEAVTDLLQHPEKQEDLRQDALALKPTLGWNFVAQQWQDEFLCVH